MIPKILHYCWFGNNPIPKEVQDCIDSWKKYCPDYEIMYWNEQNFDYDQYEFSKTAYELKKFAFVADVCRIHVLKEYGGIYLDTDIEIIKPIDDLLQNIAFSGFEDTKFVAAGIMGCEADAHWINETLDEYKKLTFTLDKMVIIPKVVTSILLRKGLNQTGNFQKIEDYITLYPIEAFYPKDYKTGMLNITPNTYVIHHYDASWVNKKTFFDNQKKNRKKAKIASLLDEYDNKVDFLLDIQHKAKISFYELMKFVLKLSVLYLKKNIFLKPLWKTEK